MRWLLRQASGGFLDWQDSPESSCSVACIRCEEAGGLVDAEHVECGTTRIPFPTSDRFQISAQAPARADVCGIPEDTQPGDHEPCEPPPRPQVVAGMGR